MRNLQVVYDLLMLKCSEDERAVNTGSFTANELKDMIVNRINENQENVKVLSLKVRIHFVLIFRNVEENKT